MDLSEVKSKSVSCIYRITFPDGKYYVGHTKNLRERVQLYERNLDDASDKSRVLCALRDCGIESVSWDVLCAVSVRNDDDLKLCLSILEIKYIRENGCIWPKGYNTSIGGELLGIPSDVIETKFCVASRDFACKAVLVYDVDGNFVAEYPSVNRCAYALGVDDGRVKDVIGKVALLRDTYMVREKRYGEVPKKILPFKPSHVVKYRVKTEYDVVREKVYKRKELDNAAIMYDKDGNYVGLFDNARQSRLFLKMEDTKLPFGREFRGVYILHYNGGEIRKSLGAFTSKNLKTMFYDDILALGDADNIGEQISLHLEEVPEKPKKSADGRPKSKPTKFVQRIDKYTLDGEYVCTYDDVKTAAEENGVRTSGIYASIKRKSRRCGDFIYRVEGDVVEPSEIVFLKHERVEKYSLDGKFICVYDSIADAASQNAMSASSVNACVTGKARRCGDFVYRFEGSDLEFPEFSEITLNRILGKDKND